MTIKEIWRAILYKGLDQLGNPDSLLHISEAIAEEIKKVGVTAAFNTISIRRIIYDVLCSPLITKIGVDILKDPGEPDDDGNLALFFTSDYWRTEDDIIEEIEIIEMTESTKVAIAAATQITHTQPSLLESTNAEDPASP